MNIIISLLIAFISGGLMGFIIAALMAARKDDDERL